MKKTIEIIFSADGAIVIEGKGFSGPACKKATQFLENALGAVASTKKKPEYDHTQSNPQIARQ